MSSTSSDPWFTTTDGMTARFTPAASCSSMWTYEPEKDNSVLGGILIQNAVYESISKNTDCYPSGFAQWGRAPSYVQVFSPGACPSGYETVGNLNGHDAGVTTAICCPSDFGYTAAVSAVLGSNKTASYWGCTSIYPRDASPTTVFAFNSGFTSEFNGEQTPFTAVSGPVLMWAQVVSVAYESKDLSLFTSGPITSPPTPIPTIPTSFGASRTAFGSSQAMSDSSQSMSQTQTSESLQPTQDTESLSSGALAGVVIGAVAVVGMLTGLAYFLWLKKRRNDTRASGQPGYGANPPMAATAQPMYKDTQFQGEDSRAYYQDKEHPQRSEFGFSELDGRHERRYELSDGT